MSYWLSENINVILGGACECYKMYGKKAHFVVKNLVETLKNVW